MKYPPVQYHEYLQLDKVLNAQHRRSEDFNKPAHDEMLFIIVHQTYELWFKQIDFELDSVLNIFKSNAVEESHMGTAVHRLERICHITKFILGQIDILETMTPLDFLDFRDFLYPASGFQSLQWRLLETKLGLKQDQRLNYQQEPFYNQLLPDQQKLIQKVLTEESLFDLVEKWLERTPFLQSQNFDFWRSYQEAVEELFSEDFAVIKNNPRLSSPEKERNTQMLESALQTFRSLFDEKQFKNLQDTGYFRLSSRAIKAALMIQIYRDQPAFQMPFRVIQALQNLDESLTQWRYRHSLMAHRMLGKKIGTGGSSGSDYLKASTEKHKIFTDFFNLTTFLIPRSRIKKLPEDLSQQMNFHF